jgi:predicted nuclease with TOPRIM domain
MYYHSSCNSQPTQADLLAEIESLKHSNTRLNSIVQELRLEISYYQGETKKLNWEKEALQQEVNSMSTAFKGWASELQVKKGKRIIEDPDLMELIVNYKPKSIAEVLNLSNQSDIFVLTSCQAPYYIEVIQIVSLHC